MDAAYRQWRRGKQCGWLKDRFGLSWQIVPEGVDEMMADPLKGARVFAAIMPMKKIDIAKLKQAYQPIGERP